VSVSAKRQNLATSRESRRYVVALPVLRAEAVGYTSRESKAHFGVPWDNRGKFTWIERGFNSCQTRRSMYPSIFNRFPVIQLVSSKVRHFSTFYAHFGLPCVRPWDNRGKCHTVVKRIQYLPCCIYIHLHTPPLFSGPAGGDDPVEIS